jgi:hypothetical protein
MKQGISAALVFFFALVAGLAAKYIVNVAQKEPVKEPWKAVHSSNLETPPIEFPSSPSFGDK